MAAPVFDVPLVNQACKVFGLHVVGHFQCNCHPDNPAQLIPGLDTAQSCDRCGRIYAITFISFDRRRNIPATVRVGIVGQEERPAGLNGQKVDL